MSTVIQDPLDALAIKAQTCPEAREELEIEILPFLQTISRRYEREWSLSKGELLAEVWVAFDKCYKRYDGRCKLTTFLDKRMRGACVDWLRRQVPSRLVYESMRAINKVSEQYYAEFGREPNVYQISDSTGMTVDTINRMRMYSDRLQPESLHRKVIASSGREEKVLCELVDSRHPTPYREAVRREFDEFVFGPKAAKKPLNKREQKILRLRNRGLSMKQIGEELGISESRVSQLIKKILARKIEAIKAGFGYRFENLMSPTLGPQRSHC